MAAAMVDKGNQMVDEGYKSGDWLFDVLLDVACSRICPESGPSRLQLLQFLVAWSAQCSACAKSLQSLAEQEASKTPKESDVGGGATREKH